MKVIIYYKFVTPEIAKKYGVTLLEDLDTLLSTADFINLHVPSTPETYHMIGGAEFKK